MKPYLKWITEHGRDDSWKFEHERYEVGVATFIQAVHDVEPDVPKSVLFGAWTYCKGVSNYWKRQPSTRNVDRLIYFLLVWALVEKEHVLVIAAAYLAYYDINDATDCNLQYIVNRIYTVRNYGKSAKQLKARLKARRKARTEQQRTRRHAKNPPKRLTWKEVWNLVPVCDAGDGTHLQRYVMDDDFMITAEKLQGSVNDIASRLNVSKKAVRRHLERLKTVQDHRHHEDCPCLRVSQNKDGVWFRLREQWKRFNQ